MKWLLASFLAIAVAAQAWWPGDCNDVCTDTAHQADISGTCHGMYLDWPFTRHFEIAVWNGGQDATYSSGGVSDGDMVWGTNIIYLNTALDPNFTNWGPVRYVVQDEPYIWGAGCATYACNNNAWPPTLETERQAFSAKIAQVKAAHPGVKVWVNFGEIEVEWWMAGQVVSPGNEDMVSMDDYGPPGSGPSLSFEATPSCSGGGCPTHSMYERLRFIKGQLRSGEVMALVPAGFQNADDYAISSVWPPIMSALVGTHKTECQIFGYLHWALTEGLSVVKVVAPWTWSTVDGGSQGIFYGLRDIPAKGYLRDFVTATSYVACTTHACLPNTCGWQDDGCGTQQWCGSCCTYTTAGCNTGETCCEEGCGHCAFCIGRGQVCP
jgi:hypothetical protein